MPDSSASANAPHPDDVESVGGWFERWGAMVAGCDFTRARTLFDPAVVGFGTYMDVVDGLDALEARQWRSIWPTISEFRFLTETLRLFMAADRCMASAMIIWNSTGFDPAGQPFPRPGRTTAVLRRTDLDAPWLGIHTHFSEFPAEHKRSFER